MMRNRKYTEEELDRIRRHPKLNFDLVHCFICENLHLLDEIYCDENSKKYLVMKYVVPQTSKEMPTDKMISEKLGVSLYQLDSSKYRAMYQFVRKYRAKVNAEQSLLDDLFPKEWHEAIRDEADKCEMTIEEYIKTCIWIELKQPRLRVTEKERDL